MEFYSEIKNTHLNKDSLKTLLTIADLPTLCRSIETVSLDNIDNGVIYCVWGEFKINREEIAEGVRFTLPNCPNAFSWTITCDGETDNIIIHFTINKKEHDAEFIETIKQFMNNWKLTSKMPDESKKNQANLSSATW